jgi:hypothetical protein
MSAISVASMPSIAAAKSGAQSFKVISLFCCCGLAASMGLLALGVDLSPAWV